MSERMLKLAGVCSTVLLFTAAPAFACAVCGGGEEESKTAFIITTIFLSVLPPAAVGGIVWWIWRRTRARALEGAESV